MKKFLLSMLMLLMSVAALRAEAQYVLREGFEGGKLPEGWSQEYVAGTQDWVVESEDLTYPAGAAELDHRIAIRNNTSQSIGFTTKLITPVMDLSEVIDPIVVFSHAQQQRSGDYEKLKVYYRSAENRPWVELKSFDQKLAGWVSDTIRLDAATKTYQVAFEVSDNMGRGVVLDDIRVRAMPTCATPGDVRIEGLTSTSFTLLWDGSLDTDSFEIVLNKTRITSMNDIDEDNIITRVFVDPSKEGFRFSTGDLFARNSMVYVYLRAHCSGELSDWTEFSLRTQNLVEIPYTQNFDMNYVTGTLNHPSYWSTGTSILKDDGSMEYMPFINTNENGTSWAQKSFTSTSCLVFTGARTTTTAIPMGEYVYAATPEMDVEDITKLTVQFWGTAYQYWGLYSSKEYESGLIVGVMEDPMNWESFVAVDTVHARGDKLFNEYNVSLASYQGKGKYIAFASNFKEKYNIFYLDDVKIDYTSAVEKATDTEVRVISSNTINIKSNLHGADSWNIAVTLADKNSSVIPLTPEESLMLTKVDGLTSSEYNLSADTLRGCAIQVYVQAVKNGVKAEWALPIKCVMPDYISAYPCTFDFEASESKWTIKDMMGNYSYGTGAGNIPGGILYNYDMQKYRPWNALTSGSSFYYTGQASYWLVNVQDSSKVAYCFFPEVADVKNTFMSFYLAAPSGSSYPANIATLEVGVMTDPYDFATFVPVDTCVGLPGELKKFSVSFESYQGDGKFIAFHGCQQKMPEGTSGTTTAGYGHVDHVVIDMPGECNAPLSIVETPLSDGFQLNWKAVGQTSWTVEVFSQATKTAKGKTYYVYEPDESTLVKKLNVSEPAATITGLNSATTYYYRISAGCGAATDVVAILTDCPVNGYALPYIEDFEAYADNQYSSSINYTPHLLPTCWGGQIVTYSSASGDPGSYYPYVTSVSSSVHAGSRSMVFGYGYNYYDMYVALPEMSDSISNLQVSFWMKGISASYQDTLEIGVMSDQKDLSTLQVVDSFVVSGSEWQEITVGLKKYAGISKGHYIAIHRPKASSHYYYLDDVKVKFMPDCGIKVQGLAATALDGGVAIEWNKQEGINNYEILITKSVIEDMENIPAAEIQYSHTTNGGISGYRDTIANSVAGFTPNTSYYVYARTACSAINIGEWSNVVSFKTSCLALTPEAFGVETFDDATRFGCWTAGVNAIYTAGGNPTMTAKIMPATGSQYLYLQDTKFTTTANKEKGGQSYVVTPSIDVEDISKLEVIFQAHKSATTTYSGRLGVGIVVDEFGSYEQVAKIDLKNVPSIAAADNYGFNEAEWYTVRFSDYVGDAEGRMGSKIAFVSLGNVDSTNYCYIDNLEIIRLAALNEPIHVHVKDMAPGTVDLAWSAETGATGYIVKYATSDFDPATDLPLVEGTKITVKTANTSTNSIQLTNMPGLTTYYVYVCSTNGTDNSRWSTMVKFKTSCPASYSLPYSEDFEGNTVAGTTTNKLKPDCWDTYYTSSSNSYNYPLVMGTAKYEGVNGFLVGGTKTPYYSYLVSPMLDDDLSKAMISFYYKSNSTSYEAQLEIGVVENVTSMETIAAEFVPLHVLKTKSGTFEMFTGTFAEYTGKGKHIVFRGTNNGSTSYYGMCIDNILVEKIPTCFPVTKVEQASATTSSLTIGITDDFGQTSWDIALVTPGTEEEDIDPAVIKTVTVNDTIEGGYFLIEGLAHSTDYDVYVRANCGAGDVSKWAKPVAMATNMLVSVDKAFWDFDDPANTTQIGTSATYILENGWMAGNKMSTSSTYIPYNVKNTINSTSGYATTKYSYSGDYALKLYSYSSTGLGAYAVLPQIDGNLDTLQLRFKVRAAYHNDETGALTKTYQSGTTYMYEVSVGTVTDPYDISTYSEVYHYNMPALTATNVSEDETGMKFWNEVTVPLFGAKGSNLVFMVDGKKTGYAYIDDVYVEKESGCGIPGALSITEGSLTDTSVDLTWVSNKTKWQIQLFEGANDTVPALDSIYTVSAIEYQTAFSLKNLNPNTAYALQVRAICGEEDMSDWATLKFTTECTPKERVEMAYNFEEGLYQYGSSTSYLIPDCWEVRAYKTTTSTGVVAQSTSQTDAPYAVSNATSATGAIYGHGNDGFEDTPGRALRFYNTYAAATLYDSYAVMPKLNFSTKGMQLHVFGRASYATNKSTKKMVANTNYDKKLYLGTMTNIDDISTFVKIDSIEYTYTTTTNDLYDQQEDQFWQEYFIDLDKFDGKQIVIYHQPRKATSYFFLDDMEILPAGYCFKPMAAKLGLVDSHSAQVSWKTKTQTEVEFATDENFENITTSVKTVNDTNAITIDGLKAATTYYVRVRHICGEENVSDWVTLPEKAVTLYEVRFAENFNANKTYPDNWSRYSKKMLIVTDGVTDGIGSPVAETASTAWKRSPSNNGMSAGHMVMSYGDATGASTNYWLITPQIDLSSIGENDSLMLSLDLALTDVNGEKAETIPDVYRPVFAVAISTDNKATWNTGDIYTWADYPFGADTIVNTTVLTNGRDTTYLTPMYGFSSIPSTFGGKKYMIDLSKYRGEVINIAFYAECTLVGGRTAFSNVLHMDNVQLNGYTISEYEQSICQWEDYADDNFVIDADDLHVGQTTSYDRFIVSSIKGGDKIVRMNLEVKPADEASFEETVCQGHKYEEHNFALVADKSCVIKQKLQGVNSCDSVVTLKLNVVETVYADTAISICHGKHVDFGGEQYYLSGNYPFTTTSLVTGCDSVITLHLTVEASLTGEDEVFLCPGTSVEFGDTTISTSGVYERVLMTSFGCDSIATLTVHEVPNENTIIRAAICQGETYNEEPFRGISRAGDYPIELNSQYGCDSIVTLHLLMPEVTDGKLTITDSIALADLPYVINNVEVLPVGTEEGIWTRTIELGCGICELTVIVGNPEDQGLDEIRGVTNYQKVFVDDQVYIICAGKWYNSIGQRVEAKW